ncbi:MAG TPA: hypothetical protein VIQ30_22715 [Pseudonocardia sp.]
MTVAVIGAVAGLAGSFLTWWATRRTTRQARQAAENGRLAAVETRVDLLETKNAILWRYSRDLVDHIYRRLPPPPPPWPAELID